VDWTRPFSNAPLVAASAHKKKAQAFQLEPFSITPGNGVALEQRKVAIMATSTDYVV
jgi:hypothetical protein